MKFLDKIGKLIELHRMNLAAPYHEYFKIEVANTEELKQVSYKLRYEVYCAELGWEEPDKFPDHMEVDEFDPWSEHCLLFHRSTNQYAGTVRLVKTHPDFPDQGIPMVEHYDGEFWDTPYSPLNMPLGSYGEISRLALLQMFRKRAGERDTPDGQGQELFEWSQTERRRFPHIALGLYLSAATAGLSQGMTGVYAMMEPRLARHLRFAGIKFEQVGDPIEFRGKRAPYYISREILLKSLVKPLRGLLYAIADDMHINLKKKF